MYKNPANTLFVGKNLIFMTSCHSTNQVAYDRIGSDPVPEGTIFITSNQTAGRGQMGNTWEAEPGKNLTLSLVLRPSFLEASRQFMLNMAISLGISDWLMTWSDDFRIKWPNDLFHKDRKMGGILIQNMLRGSSLGDSIAGIGLNINQNQFSVQTATSLTEITGETFALPALLEPLCICLEQRYLQLRGGGKGLHDEYLNRLYRAGEEHLFHDGQYFRGTIQDVEPDGRLIIRTPSGRRSYGFKEVSYVI